MVDGIAVGTAAIRNAYTGRRVLVTGDTGFKGSWLCEWLLRLGADVHGLGLAPATEPALFEELTLKSRIRHHSVDIRDAGTLSDTVASIQPSVVFHLAAQALVRASYDFPQLTVDTNVSGTVNLLAAVQSMADALDLVCAVVVVTSDKCYQNDGGGRRFVETDPMGGADIYSASKGAAELVVDAWRRSFDTHPDALVRIATARAGNVIGGGDWATHRIVPDAVRALQAGHPIPVRNPQAIRPWQHVLDPLGGYLILGARLLANEPVRSAWNFGPVASAEVDVASLCDLVVQFWGEGMWQVESDGGPTEATYLALSIDKATRSLGWQPAWGLEDSVRSTVDWYREVLIEGAHAPDVTSRQISEFEAAADWDGL